MRTVFVTAALILVASMGARGIDVVSEEASTAACEEWNLFDEVPVYRDPSFFLPHLILLKSDPAYGWKSLMQENPQLTTLSGRVQVARLAPPREFSGFGDIAALYESVEPRLKMRPSKRETAISIQQIRICGANNPYSDSFGFVVEDDVERARKPSGGVSSGRPPSVRGNPIPTLE